MGKSKKKKSPDAQKKEEEEHEKFKKTVEAVFSKLETKQAQENIPTNQQKPSEPNAVKKKYRVDYNDIIRRVMEYRGYDPEEIEKKFARQGVYGRAFFRCKTCGKGWKSEFGWVVIDLKRQKTGKFFKQGCLRCDREFEYKSGPFFHVKTFIGMVHIALDKYEYYCHCKEPEGSDDGGEPGPTDSLKPQKDDEPHKRGWCERCEYKGTKCWIHGKQCMVAEGEIEAILKDEDDTFVPVGLNKDDGARKHGKENKLANKQAEGDVVASSRNDNEP